MIESNDGSKNGTAYIILSVSEQKGAYLFLIVGLEGGTFGTLMVLSALYRYFPSPRNLSFPNLIPNLYTGIWINAFKLSI